MLKLHKEGKKPRKRRKRNFREESLGRREQEERSGEGLRHYKKMFALIWIILLYSGRDTSADSGAPVRMKENCYSLDSGYYCITINEEIMTAEAGLCVVIPCSFRPSYYFTPTVIVWFKCDAWRRQCVDSDIIFHSNNFNKVQSDFRGRVSLLEPDIRQRNCSIIINDLKESDSGAYQLRINGILYNRHNGFTFPPRSTVTVRGLSQKPKVQIPPLTEGQQTKLTCTAPGLCSGSQPEITWIWRGKGESNSQITENITEFHTENLTAVTQRHSSTLTFNLSSEHHGTTITCEVSFLDGITTEETVMLNVSYVKEVKITGDTVTEGETLNLTCSVDSFPPSKVTWTRFGDENQLQDISSAHLQENPGITSVSISNVTVSVSGPYVCTAEHVTKTLSKRVNVTVTYKRNPQVIGNVTLKERDELNLTCIADSVPPSIIIWTKQSARGINIHGNTRSATLVISNVTKEDSGQYICTAEYLNEKVAIHADVQVQWFSKILNGSGCVAQSEVLTCVCLSEGVPLPTIKWPLLKDHTGYSIITTVSNNSVNSTVSLTAENSDNVSVECVSSSENEEAKENLTVKNGTGTNKVDESTDIMGRFSRLEVIVAFFIGVLLSAIVCCLLKKCKRMKQKKSENVGDNLELINSQDPLIYECQAVEDKDQKGTETGAAAAEKVVPEPNFGPNDVEYANIDFSKLKRRGSRKAAKELENTSTEYAEIKTRGKKKTHVNGEVKMSEGKEEEPVAKAEEEIKAVDERGDKAEAVYSTVKEAMDEI